MAVVTHWKDAIDNPAELKVFEALENGRWDFRTVQGIAAETHIDAKVVEEILQNHIDLVRESTIPDKHGNRLFTLRTKPKKLRERVSEIRAFISKSFN